MSRKCLSNPPSGLLPEHQAEGNRDAGGPLRLQAAPPGQLRDRGGVQGGDRERRGGGPRRRLAGEKEQSQGREEDSGEERWHFLRTESSKRKEAKLSEESSVRVQWMCMGWPFCHAELRQEFQTGRQSFFTSLQIHEFHI